MEQLEGYKGWLENIYPGFKIDSMTLNQHGQNNNVMIVNGEWVFRFPKYEQGIEQLKKEVRLLNKLRKHITLNIPNPQWLYLESQVVGEVFAGYPMIKGRPLWEKDFNEIKDERCYQDLANQLANFLKELHSIPIEEVTASAKETHDYMKVYHDMYKKIQERLFSYMSKEGKKQVSKHFESFLYEGKAMQFTPVWTHGDMGPSNIIYDKDEKVIKGIIDFGLSQVGDPADDFAGIYKKYGKEFLDRFSLVYPGIDQMIKRIKFYQGTYALQEALFGIENNDREAFDAGMKDYIV